MSPFGKGESSFLRINPAGDLPVMTDSEGTNYYWV